MVPCIHLSPWGLPHWSPVLEFRDDPWGRVICCSGHLYSFLWEYWELCAASNISNGGTGCECRKFGSQLQLPTLELKGLLLVLDWHSFDQQHAVGGENRD